MQRARPIVEDGIQKARPVVEDGIQQAEHLRKMSVRYWRENGKREARQALRDVQAHLSTPVNLIKTMLFLEMVSRMIQLHVRLHVRESNPST